MHSWREAELKAPIWLALAGKIDPEEKAFPKVAKVPCVTRKFSYLCLKKAEEEKSNSENA